MLEGIPWGFWIEGELVWCAVKTLFAIGVKGNLYDRSLVQIPMDVGLPKKPFVKVKQK